MARPSDRDDPLSALRRLLRDVRDSARCAASRDAVRFCAGVPEEQRQGALRGTIEIALYRLPARQREILRRHDLDGEPARSVQRALALSRRQFYRDRHIGLTALRDFLFGGTRVAPAASPPQSAPVATRRERVTASDAQAARRTLARGLWQSGNAACVDVLSELAALETNAMTRTELLLDLADAAADYENESTAIEAMKSARATCRRDYVAARVLRTRARFDSSVAGARALYANAVQLLRADLADDTASLAVRSTLADTLADLACADFSLGALADSREAAAEAATIVETFGLSSRPKALETLGINAVIEGTFTGRTVQAIDKVSALLLRAIDAGWCGTASRLGANLVGLTAVRGDHTEAIRWYERIAPLIDGARPADRSNLAMEAAHAYTMTGRADAALAVLGAVKPGAGAPLRRGGMVRLRRRRFGTHGKS